MKIVLNVVAVLLALFGLIWFLQGVNVLPGSFMTGQIRWAIYGGIAFAAGVGILLKVGVRRIIVNTIAAIFLLMGSVWFLQGINVLPGSFMTGQMRWAIYGGILDAVGIAVLLANNRKTTAG
jgi:hypothetical protein